MSKAIKRPSIRMPSLKEDRLIKQAAKDDPDAKPLSLKQMKAMVPMRAALGRPKSENKKLLVSVRYSPEVISFFKATGDGWQSRIDSVLRDYVSRQSRSE